MQVYIWVMQAKHRFSLARDKKKTNLNLLSPASHNPC